MIKPLAFVLALVLAATPALAHDGHRGDGAPPGWWLGPAIVGTALGIVDEAVSIPGRVLAPLVPPYPGYTPEYGYPYPPPVSSSSVWVCDGYGRCGWQ